jgi:hypothetical protein
MAESNKLMTQLLLANQSGTKPAEEQPPAPATLAEAMDEIDRIASDETFTDMSAAVAPIDEFARQSDETLAEYETRVKAVAAEDENGAGDISAGDIDKAMGITNEDSEE